MQSRCLQRALSSCGPSANGAGAVSFPSVVTQGGDGLATRMPAAGTLLRSDASVTAAEEQALQEATPAVKAMMCDLFASHHCGAQQLACEDRCISSAA